MNSKNIIISIVASTLISLLILTIIHRWYESRSERLETTDTVRIEKTDTLWKTDTFKLVKFYPKDRWTIKTDTVMKDGQIIALKTEQVKYQDTIVNYQDTIISTAYVSGINPKLDSLSFITNKKELHTTQTVEIVKYKEKKKLFNVAPQATFGYDPLNKNWGLVIGIGVGLNI